MKKSWIKGLDADQVKELKKHYANADIFRDKLSVLLINKEQETYRNNTAVTRYDDPNWAHKQADTIGYIRALRYVQDLIKE